MTALLIKRCVLDAIVLMYLVKSILTFCPVPHVLRVNECTGPFILLVIFPHTQSTSFAVATLAWVVSVYLVLVQGCVRLSSLHLWSCSKSSYRMQEEKEEVVQAWKPPSKAREHTVLLNQKCQPPVLRYSLSGNVGSLACIKAWEQPS